MRQQRAFSIHPELVPTTVRRNHGHVKTYACSSRNGPDRTLKREDRRRSGRAVPDSFKIRPLAKDEVAAGEGAFRTCVAPGVCDRKRQRAARSIHWPERGHRVPNAARLSWKRWRGHIANILTAAWLLATPTGCPVAKSLASIHVLAEEASRLRRAAACIPVANRHGTVRAATSSASARASPPRRCAGDVHAEGMAALGQARMNMLRPRAAALRDAGGAAERARAARPAPPTRLVGQTSPGARDGPIGLNAPSACSSTVADPLTPDRGDLAAQRSRRPSRSSRSMALATARSRRSRSRGSAGRRDLGTPARFR